VPRTGLHSSTHAQSLYIRHRFYDVEIALAGLPGSVTGRDPVDLRVRSETLPGMARELGASK
jgi:hypothetical protein